MSTPTSGLHETTGRPRVLVVDDDLDSAELMTVLLERSRCIARSAADADEALVVALEFLPMVALIDIGLPRTDGFDLCKRMRLTASLAHCRYIAVTGYDRADLEHKNDFALFDAHVAKPVDFATLYKAVAAQLLECPAFKIGAG